MKYQASALVILLVACKGAPDDLHSIRKQTSAAVSDTDEADSQPNQEQKDPITDKDPVDSEELEGGTTGHLPTPGSDGDELPAGPDLPSRTAPAFCSDIKTPGDWTSAKVKFNSDGKLEYASDADRNRIVDFSYAGYHYGLDEIPVYPVTQTLGPVAGDNTKSIQDALDALAARLPDSRGIRGALQLKPGRYQILGTLRINASGLVLRGSGSGSDASRNTIISAEKNVPHQRTVIKLGNGKSGNWRASGSAVEVTDAFVPVGSMSFSIKDASNFKPNDLIQIKHPSTQAWINALKGGGPVNEPHWKAGSTDILFNRRITAKDGNRITLDAPIYNSLDRSLTISTVSRIAAQDLVSESGLENLRIEIETKGGEDENHAWDAVSVHGAQDSWVKDITALHFGQAGVVTTDALRITVDNVTAIEPVGIRTGGRFYNFNAYAMSQLILFKNCHAKDGRHNFISNGVQTTSGIVWYKCTSEGASASEGHRRWSQGMLFDSISEKNGGSINLFNRGDAGTSHGWGAVHSVIWNYNGNSILQKPPTAQNYFISPNGTLKTRAGEANGHVEIKSGRLSPRSLYEAQLCERFGI